MNTINISVAGEELEVITIELTSEEVAALYKLRKENAARIVELEKKLEEAVKAKEYSSKREDEARSEIGEANTLLTALGVPEKTNNEEVYYRQPLKIATRVALLIAGVKTT